MSLRINGSWPYASLLKGLAHGVVDDAAAGLLPMATERRLQVRLREFADFGLRRLGENGTHGRHLERTGERLLHQCQQPRATGHRAAIINDFRQARLQQATKLGLIGFQKLDVGSGIEAVNTAPVASEANIGEAVVALFEQRDANIDEFSLDHVRDVAEEEEFRIVCKKPLAISNWQLAKALFRAADAALKLCRP